MVGLGNYLTQPLHRSVQRNPGGIAACDGGGEFTWQQLGDRAARLAGGLKTMGLEPGGRVAILSRNSADFLLYLLGTWWAGGVVNPVNLRWSPQEIAFSLEDCETRILLIEEPFLGLLDAIRRDAPGLRQIVVLPARDGTGATGEIPHELQGFEEWLGAASPVPDALRSGSDLAAILYTGGTTGKPKGVMLSHDNLAASLLGAMAMPGFHARDRFLHIAPLFHIGALVGLLVSLYSHSSHYFVPMFEPVAVLQAIERYAAEDTFLVPTMLRMLVDHPRFGEFDCSSMQMIRYGASPMDAGLLNRAFAAFPGCAFAQAYGMTELSPIATILTDKDHIEGREDGRLRTAGRAIPTVEVRIVDDAGSEVPRGEIGEIVVRGPNVMLGYWNRPEATGEALRGGWMHTGDAGTMDARGYVAVIDRLKDMIITGGENVYSAEVESALSTHPDVSQVAVIALPDEEWGERVHAVVVPRSGASPDPDALTRYCKDQIAGYKAPRSFAFVDALPLTGAGKVAKNVLREQSR